MLALDLLVPLGPGCLGQERAQAQRALEANPGSVSPKLRVSLT